jgi:hypothetical protein
LSNPSASPSAPSDRNAHLDGFLQDTQTRIQTPQHADAMEDRPHDPLETIPIPMHMHVHSNQSQFDRLSTVSIDDLSSCSRDRDNATDHHVGAGNGAAASYKNVNHVLGNLHLERERRAKSMRAGVGIGSGSATATASSQNHTHPPPPPPQVRHIQLGTRQGSFSSLSTNTNTNTNSVAIGGSLRNNGSVSRKVRLQSNSNLG